MKIPPSRNEKAQIKAVREAKSVQIMAEVQGLSVTINKTEATEIIRKRGSDITIDIYEFSLPFVHEKYTIAVIKNRVPGKAVVTIVK